VLLLYTAVMVWLPVDSDELASVGLSAAECPRTERVGSSLNVTVPLGSGPRCHCATIAVNVTTGRTPTGSPKCPSAGGRVRLVDGCVKLGEVLVLKFESPLYTALMT